MKYHLFLDESGDHGLKTVDENFPVFVLCGVLFSAGEHTAFVERMNGLKQRFWKSQGVIFHSRDIRRCEKEFSIFLNLEVKRSFYEELNAIIAETGYTIISAVIRKDEYIKKYGKTGNVYSVALSFIIERAVFFLDTKDDVEGLEIIVEKRGRNEDLELSEHYNKVCSLGTYYVSPKRINACGMTMRFKAKKENINGLQLADLVAYPIANHIIDPERVNLPFEIVKSKFYSKQGKTYGLKQFP